MDTRAKLEFAVSMNCSSCVHSIEKALAANSDITDVTINFDNQQVVLETSLSSDQVKDIIEGTGSLAALVGIGSTLGRRNLGTAVVEFRSSPIKGIIRLLQLDENLCLVDGMLDGLSPGNHGLNIHTYGDVSQGCNSCGGHYNPFEKRHGGPNDVERHVGDLGNVTADENGTARFKFTDKCLQVFDLIGRAMVIHEKGDDFGKGGNSNSSIDGDSGKGIACAIIARSAGIFENTKRFCACDGITVWEERNVPEVGEGRQKASQSNL